MRYLIFEAVVNTARRGKTLALKCKNRSCFTTVSPPRSTPSITESIKLAILGGSNCGLLVGAVITRQPDLAAVALPAVGVLDLLRHHTFTAGAVCPYYYGTAEQSTEMFEYLFSYPPVHNV